MLCRDEFEWKSFVILWLDGLRSNENTYIPRFVDVTHEKIHKSGAVGLAVGHPMDTVKTIQQMDNRSLSSIDVMARIIRGQGVVGFYKGMMFPLLSAGTLNCVFFGVYGNSLRALQLSRGNDPENIVPQGIAIYEDTFIAGCLGGIVQSIIACPSEFIKVRLQTGQEYFSVEEQTFAKSRKPENRSTYKIIQDAYRTLGLRGLYTGFLPMLLSEYSRGLLSLENGLVSLVCRVLNSSIEIIIHEDRDVSASGIYVLAYLYARHHLHGHLELHPGKFETLVAGGLAGTVSWIPVVPLDTIKSRIQADNLRNPLYRGTVDCAIKLFRHGGMQILFKGFVMIAVRSFPVNASLFLSYDTIMQYFKYFLAD